jgi:hypothetical protein
MHASYLRKDKRPPGRISVRVYFGLFMRMESDAGVTNRLKNAQKLRMNPANKSC